MKDNIPQNQRENTHWYECEVWKHFKTTGASMNSKWGLDRIMELRWCKSGLGKNHLCTWSDRNHKVIADYEKRKLAGKEHGSTYDTTDSFFYHLNHNCKKKKCKPYKTTTDEYGNKTRYFKDLTPKERKEYKKEKSKREKK